MVGRREITDALDPEEVVAFESGELAYTVGYERGEVVVDSGEKRTVTFRVT